jgi:hypothetical protein
MDEVFPVLGGIVIGLALNVLPVRLRPVAFAILVLTAGATASWISGELAVSWGYVVIDVAEVALAAVMTLVLVTAWRRRARWVG